MDRWFKSNRALARELGVSESAVRKAETTGRIERDDDGTWDIEVVKLMWKANTRGGERYEWSTEASAEGAGSGAILDDDELLDLVDRLYAEGKEMIDEILSIDLSEMLEQIEVQLPPDYYAEAQQLRKENAELRARIAELEEMVHAA
ncbi:MAG: hypothetical protein HQL53_12095 [Magnetococcales bacterium]|nr:hypothetical protein [Magnetococcales bacterium]